MMKRTLSALSLLLFSFSLAAQEPMKERSGINSYFVKINHTKENCSKALTEMSSKPGLLNRFQYGCESNVHSCYAFVSAKNDSMLQSMFPELKLSKIEFVKVNRLKPADPGKKDPAEKEKEK